MVEGSLTRAGQDKRLRRNSSSDWTTPPALWEEGVAELGIDRGPCTVHVWSSIDPVSVQKEWSGDGRGTPCSSIPKREMAIIRNPPPRLSILGRTKRRRDTYIHLLGQFLEVLPHILPSIETLYIPILLHHDLHAKNIFMNSSDPTKISTIINWSAIYTAPLFMQSKFPSVSDCEDPYSWGAV